MGSLAPAKTTPRLHDQQVGLVKFPLLAYRFKTLFGSRENPSEKATFSSISNFPQKPNAREKEREKCTSSGNGRGDRITTHACLLEREREEKQ